MRFVLSFGLAAALAAITLDVANAHTALQFVGANGEFQAQGVSIVPSEMKNAPVKDLDSKLLQCRTANMSTAKLKKLVLKAGGTLSLRWKHYDNSVKIPVMSLSHVGPCLVYFSRLDKNGQGPVWFKVYEEGYNKSTKTWCSNKVIKNGGKLDIPVPKSLPNGDYLVRSELIALHQANVGGGAQLYPNCLAVTVSGGSGTLPKGHAIPGIYRPSDPGILFDRAKGGDSYKIPGPPVMEGGTSL
ncbi:hypothetical protein IWQ56_000833 [Coemansia nantahalensis]|uniref:Uncharacterized protein n=1 Tax=Coemansia nantahalensis TaxID=2789366 RepID=A0ACC1K0E4_9FUNG|nr:hypothetical protein IWQ57_002499 [Coemansia nantahalensis]KAJ2773845.1 hypothetical protein IWQ56_000833 [Coemansia nantahalensis]